MNHGTLKAIIFAGLIATQANIISAQANTLSTNADWTWMKGTNIVNQPGIYGTQGVPAATNTPGARFHAVSWTDGAGALWLFGGVGYDSIGIASILNDLWKYDVGGVISLTTNALVFSATCQGVSPAAQMIGMTNVGVTAFIYTNVITYGAGASRWLTVLPSAGTVALNGATVLTNQVNIIGLGVGTYYATNQVAAADATNSPQTVVVTLTVWAPVAADFDKDGKADFVVVDPTGVWKIWLSDSGYASVTTIPLIP